MTGRRHVVDSARRAGVACAVGLVLAAGAARGHPEGASSVDRYLDFVRTGDGRFRVAYRLDFAETPAYAEIDALDADHDGRVTADEQRRYTDARVPPLVAAWVVEVNGERVRPSVVACHLETAPGQGGMDTLRVDCEVAVVGPPSLAGQGDTLDVRDDVFADRPGWREISARDALAPDASLTPLGPGGAGDAGRGGRPHRVSEARFVFPVRPGGSTPTGPGAVVVALRLLAILVGLPAVAALLLRRRRKRLG